MAPFVLYGLFSAIGGVAAGAVGVLVGLGLLVVLFIVGSRKAIKWRCGNCKNPVVDKAVLMCPVCRATLS